MPKIINQRHLRVANVCTCIYHIVDMYMIPMEEYVKTTIQNIISSFIPPEESILELIYAFLASKRRPNPMFIDFILTPHINDENRRMLILRIWQFLLVEQNTVQKVLTDVASHKMYLKFTDNALICTWYKKLLPVEGTVFCMAIENRVSRSLQVQLQVAIDK